MCTSRQEILGLDLLTKYFVNKGPAHSRNLGILNASNSLVVFTDDDVIVDKHWIKAITLKLLNSDEKLVGFFHG